jgi:hypothetical protein
MDQFEGFDTRMVTDDDPEPPRTNDADCSDLEYTEIERWVRRRVQRRIREWEQRDPPNA